MEFNEVMMETFGVLWSALLIVLGAFAVKYGGELFVLAQRKWNRWRRPKLAFVAVDVPRASYVEEFLRTPLQ